ncbi:MAG TPA: DUF4326 domain-containing protein [Tepidisphaeraceae bacterium]|jgi:hypothetical protein
MTAKRIQCSRVKGYRLPPNTVRVSRPSRFGNPFKVDGITSRTREEAIAHYERWLKLEGRRIAQLAREQLRGKNLACFCPAGLACHADVLLRIANGTRKS